MPKIMNKLLERNVEKIEEMKIKLNNLINKKLDEAKIAKENWEIEKYKILKEEVALRKMLDNEYVQVKMANSLLRDLLALKESIVPNTIAAEIIKINLILEVVNISERTGAHPPSPTFCSSGNACTVLSIASSAVA